MRAMRSTAEKPVPRPVASTAPSSDAPSSLPASLLRTLKRGDGLGSRIPGEHWVAASVGTALLRRSWRSGSPLLRTAAWIAGAVLLYRATSGREGPFGQRRQRSKL